MHVLSKLSATSITCEVCLRSKQSRAPFVIEIPKRPREALKVINFDICGPLEVQSLGGSKYFITFVD